MKSMLLNSNIAYEKIKKNLSKNITDEKLKKLFNDFLIKLYYH